MKLNRKQEVMNIYRCMTARLNSAFENRDTKLSSQLYNERYRLLNDWLELELNKLVK